jgi:D-alanyl-D-alanine carboxypeptidase (penicillin-binding protein 5/6)
MPQATLPVAGRQYNVDALLGKDGIVGIKTGSTSRAGACFVFAAHEALRGHPVTVVGAVLHQTATRAQPSALAAVFHASTALLASAHRSLVRRPAAGRAAAVAWLKAPWMKQIAVESSRPVSFVGWAGLPIHTTVGPAPAPTVPIKAGETIGTAVVSAGEQRARVRLVASRAVSSPSFSWRLTHS